MPFVEYDITIRPTSARILRARAEEQVSELFSFREYSGSVEVESSERSEILAAIWADKLEPAGYPEAEHEVIELNVWEPDEDRP